VHEWLTWPVVQWPIAANQEPLLLTQTQENLLLLPVRHEWPTWLAVQWPIAASLEPPPLTWTQEKQALFPVLLEACWGAAGNPEPLPLRAAVPACQVRLPVRLAGLAGPLAAL
jgi:hypothetical protein